ncbi:helix-turn-helix domain-containing protein [Enterococcus sp. AZ126]|uniref:helix-turn-helix domain-containing protein n=1 Tax=Enterococcus sp. AZ126 TaxID=2774635 RepID=UPI003F24AB9C
MEIDLKEAGNRIKEIRKKHKYSMALFSNLVGNSSASTVNNWEKGNNLPKSDRLEKIAILGNTTADWIRYGDFTEYVKKLLAEANLRKELDLDQLEQLLVALKKKKITYGQDLEILTKANEFFPYLFDTRYQLNLSEQHAPLIAEDFVTYKIEQNDRYRKDFLPMIEELLYDSSEKEINASVLFLVLDLLKRTKTSNNRLSIPKMFTILSEVLTNDIAYKNNSTSKVIDYSDITNTRDKSNPLSEKIVTKKYTQTKNDLLHLLDEFYFEKRKK